MKYITPHFTYQEATFSPYAIRHSIDNSLPDILLENVKRQAELMEKVRYELGKPIFVSSWYRCPELNQAIGGAIQSAHIKALATDFVSPFGTPTEICQKIIASGIEFDQLIDEGTWVHIALSALPSRNQVLTAHFHKGKPTTYSIGLDVPVLI